MFRVQKCPKNSIMVLAIAGLVVGMLFSNVVSVYGVDVVSAVNLSTSSPLKQFKSGTLSENIQCNVGLQLIIKAKDSSPACVKPSTATILVSWGWAKSIIGSVQNSRETPSQKVITLADNGKSITLQKGDSFLLKLGEMYDWNVAIDNQTVVSRVVNIMVIRGAQGVYDAHNLGQAVLTGAGDPLCRSSVPACEMPSILFKLNIAVVPTLDNSKSLTVLTDKDQYKIGETININITNNGNTRLFPIGWGYSIDDSNGTHYAPTGVLRMMLIALTPGNSVHWTWNQLDANGIQVNPGQYNITASYAEENTQKQFTSSKIIEITGP